MSATHQPKHRSFGVEEEFMLLHAETLSPVDAAGEILPRLKRDASPDVDIHAEFFASQVEHSSVTFSSLRQAATTLHEFRASLAKASADLGLIAAGVGVPYRVSGPPTLTATDRYARLGTEFRAVVLEHQINGMHVHVSIDDRDEGVIALNTVREWLPTLLAIASNSPFWAGVDTGFASWRAIHSRRWSTAGCPPTFFDGKDYARRLGALVGVGGIIDRRTISWYARLSESHPTLEFRVSDAQLDVNTTLLLAVISRALVVTAVANPASRPRHPAPSEFMAAALWHAARDGLDGRLVEPSTRLLQPSIEVVDALVDTVWDALDSDESVFVADELERLRRDGSGATRQRRAFAEGGTSGLRRLLHDSLALPPRIT